jgi:hypothetical protein
MSPLSAGDGKPPIAMSPFSAGDGKPPIAVIS